MKALDYLGSTAAAIATSARPESPSVAVADDLRALDRAAFWRTLDRRVWRRSHDAEGRRQDCGGIPDSIAGLKDDPFRSHARAVRWQKLRTTAASSPPSLQD